MDKGYLQAHGDYRFGHMPSGPSTTAGMAGDLFAASSKHPPYRGPERERTYPFRHWMKDVRLWALATDVSVERQGPLLASRLGGMARAIAHEMPENFMVYGGPFQGLGQLTGLKMLLRGLSRRFMPFNGEISARAMIEFLSFRRSTHETIDEALSRGELLKLRAAEQAGFDISPSGASLLMMLGLGVPRTAWWHYLSATGGDFPADEAAVAALQEKLRRELHFFNKESKIW